MLEHCNNAWLNLGNTGKNNSKSYFTSRDPHHDLSVHYNMKVMHI